MSRVVLPASARALALTLLLVLAAGAFAGAAAQDLPPCSDGRWSGCRLPAWPDAAEAELPSLFGPVDGVVWLEDAAGDAPAGGLDILAVGLGRVRIEEPAAVRKAEGLLKRGKAKRAVRAGESVLVRVVLERPPQQSPGDHASVHLATDIDGSRSNNVPSGVGSPDFPFSGSEDVYSLTWAATTGKTKLLSSEPGRGWYKAKTPFAASWAAADVLDLLVPTTAIGEGFRVVTHAAGTDGGYDIVSLGPAAIPADGRLGLVPSCVEGSISTEPFIVSRLNENGQTVRDVEAPASWRGGAAVPVDEDIRSALTSLIAERDEDGDGIVALPAWVSLFEEGLVIRQRPDLQLAFDGEQAQLSLELGLTRRGYNVLRDFEPESTGDAQLDAWIEGATDALRETMPPFRSTKKAGLLIGGAVGACIPWLTPPVPAAADGSAAEPATEPAGEAAAST